MTDEEIKFMLSNTEETKFMLSHTVVAVCCRNWEVSPFSALGRCGYCGERPVIIRKEENA